MNTQDLFKSRYFQLNPVAEGVYAAIIIGGTGALGNAGIVDLGDRTLVFDTCFTPQAAEDLRLAAEQLFDRPVDLVVNSHWHNDHILGNQVFRNANIISTAKTRESIEARVPGLLEFFKTHPEYPEQLAERANQETDEIKRQEILANLGDVQTLVAALPTLELHLPNLTFEHEITFHGSKRNATLLTYGGGHTQSDAILFLPRDQVAFMGDLLSVNNHNQFRDGDATEWIRILQKVEQLPIQTAIPGHGPVGTMEDITTMRVYFEELLQLASQLSASDLTAEQVSDWPIPEKYASWAVPFLYDRNIKQLLEQHHATVGTP